MKYIIMCGGQYRFVNGQPRQLLEINGEPIVARTIRLLRENRVEDIAISSNNPVFEKFGVPVIKDENNTFGQGGMWIDGFVPTDKPTCFIFGDVVFSPEAIKEIVETETDDIEFFASAPPFSGSYIKSWAEPFAFKITNVPHFRQAKAEVYGLNIAGRFAREPIAWELWQVIKESPINVVNYTNYHIINDYTCDVDHLEDLKKMREVLK